MGKTTVTVLKHINLGLFLFIFVTYSPTTRINVKVLEFSLEYGLYFRLLKETEMF